MVDGVLMTEDQYSRKGEAKNRVPPAPFLEPTTSWTVR
jgi:hypothetical protein